MKFEKIGIAIARINGLTENPYYFSAKCYWAWSIMFSESSCLCFCNLPRIFLSENSEKEAEQKCDKYKKHFSDAGIREGDEVVVIFSEDGDVRAIGSKGRDAWIDVEDRFVKKTFKELNIIITSLEVH